MQMLYTPGSPHIKKEMKTNKKNLLIEVIFLPIMLLNPRTCSRMEASVYAYHHHIKTGD